ncbi:MAG: DUF6658 family protein [Cyanobacteria bacterium J06621_12]
MKKLINAIKSIKIKKILTVFLAGFLLIVSTACSQSTVAQAETKAETAMSSDYDAYDANQEYKGGMNGYNDDRRYDAETAAKAKALVDTAESRQEDSLGDYAESITNRAGDKIDEAKNEIPRALQSNKEDAVEYVQNKSDKLQSNLSKVPEGAKEIFEGATDTAQDALKDASKATKSTAKEIKSNFEDLDLT